jgi:hypothetical protein
MPLPRVARKKYSVTFKRNRIKFYIEAVEGFGWQKMKFLSESIYFFFTKNVKILKILHWDIIMQSFKL